MKWMSVISFALLIGILSGCVDDSFGGSPSDDNTGSDERVPLFV